MKRYLMFGIVFAIFLFYSQSLRALDLTPHFEEIEDDGIAPVHRLFFNDGEKKVYLVPSKTWTVEGVASEAIFKPGLDSESMVKFSLSRGAPLIFNENGIAACHARVQGLLREGAKNYILVEEVKNPYSIKQWDSYQIVGRYNFYGIWMMIEVIFIDLDPQQLLTVLISGPETEFDKVNKETKKLLLSWIKE